MPIKIHIHGKGVYRAGWQGDVTIGDVTDAHGNISQFADFHDVGKYVLIMDMMSVGRIPFDVANLWRSIDGDNRVSAYIVVNPPIRAQVILKMLQRLSTHEFHYVRSLEEAEEVAMLLDYSSVAG